MKNKYIILIFFFIVSIVSIFLLKFKKNGIKNNINDKRVIDILTPVASVNLSNNTYHFRLDICDNDIFVIGETEINKIDTSTMQLGTRYPVKNAYNVFKYKNIIAYYNEKTNSLYNLKTSNVVSDLKINNDDDNILVIDSTIYSVGSNNQIFFYTLLENNTKKIADLKNLLGKYNPSKDSMAFKMSLYGEFSKYDKDNILYLPRYYGYAFIINRNTIEIKNLRTIDEREALNLKKVEVTVPGYGKIFKYESDDGTESIHTSPSVTDNSIAILSSLALKKKDNFYNAIDIYKKATLRYHKTYFINIDYNKKIFVLDFEIDKNFIYVLFSNGIVSKYKYED